MFFKLTTILFIWSISTIFAMVTFLKFGYTFFAVGTSKFRQITRSAFTLVFILMVATIIISVTFFGFGNAKAVSTFDILVLACAIIWKIILKVTNRLCSTMYVLGKKNINGNFVVSSCWKKLSILRRTFANSAIFFPVWQFKRLVVPASLVTHISWT